MANYSDKTNNWRLPEQGQVAFIKLPMPGALEASSSELDEALARKVAAEQQRQHHQQQHWPDEDDTDRPKGRSVCVGGLRVLGCDVFAILLTIIIFSAGLYSWEDKRQLQSVMAASAFSIALAVSTYMEGVRRNPYPLLLTCVGLMGMMEMRWVISKHYVPPGLLLTFASFVFLRHMLLLYLRYPTK